MPQDIATLAREAVADLECAGPSVRRVIGVTGVPGAGKSTLVQALVRASIDLLGCSLVAGLPMDGFHLPNSRLAEIDALGRKGAPDTFDASGFVAKLRGLVTPGATALSWPGYSRRVHEPIPDAIIVPATVKLAFVEGNYLLLNRPPWQETQALFSAVWYLAADIRAVQTRLRRRHSVAGRSATQIEQRVAQDLENITLVEQTRLYADRVIAISANDPLLSGLTDPATDCPILLDEPPTISHS